MAKDAPGMRGERSRNETGRLRQKRSDTLAGTIEERLGVDLGVRSDMTLGALRERFGVTSEVDVLAAALVAKAHRGG